MMLRKNKNWNMIIEDNKLFITKGADEIYFLDEVKEDNAAVIFSAYEKDLLGDLAQEHKDIVKKLEQAGVVYKEWFEPKKNIRLAIQYCGSTNDRLTNALSEIKDVTLTDEMVDLLLIVRTNTSLKNILKDYTIQVPQLFVDIAYSHIISIGPLIHKKHTACLGCFVGRLTHNWGDPAPPENPCANDKTALIAALLQEKLAEYALLGNCPDLINHVWNFNTKRFTAKFDRVHKLPWCPVCGRGNENAAFPLPWSEIL